MEDARALDELTNDLTANYVLHDHTFNSCRVHPIIQCGRAARTRQGRKPGAERWLRVSYDLANEHVGALRAAAEAALPRQLCAGARIVRLQRRSEHLMQRGGAATIAAFGASTDDDLEATWRRQSPRAYLRT